MHVKVVLVQMGGMFTKLLNLKAIQSRIHRHYKQNRPHSVQSVAESMDCMHIGL